MIIAIDNGVSGGCVAMTKSHGLIIDKIPMPTKKVDDKNEINTAHFWHWVRNVTQGNFAAVTFILERPVGSKSAAAATSMAGSFHALRATLESRGLQVGRVSPKTWQKALGVDSDEKKAKAIQKAYDIWPDEDWLATPRSTTPHTGMVDAALIGHFLRTLDFEG